MNRFIIGVVLLSFASISFSYEGSPKEQVSQFFKEMKKNEINMAVQHLFENNPIISKKSQQVTLVKQQLAMVATLYGKYIGNENILYEEISPSLVRILELEKHEKHSVVWEFYFYKPKDKWIVSKGQFEDQFQLLGTKK